MARDKSDPIALEIQAMSTVHTALKNLDPAARSRVFRYAGEMLGITLDPAADRGGSESHEQKTTSSSASSFNSSEDNVSDEFEGINAVAVRWVKRANLNPISLQKLFSLGVDEIDLVANKVPGDSKKDRMKSVLLLKGIAAYLGTGVARITYEQLKEACLHYNGYDSGNFAAYLKSFAAEVGGSKETGFTLTARGLNSGTELVKEMLAAS